MPEFVHLHNHTHYSLLDGACSVDGLIEAAVENKMPAVGLTDHGVNFGLLEFYQKARKAGIKPILGCEVYVADSDRFDKSALKQEGNRRRRNYFHLILLAKNSQGYKTLNKLTSRAHTEGFYYKPRIDRTLLQENHEGLVCLSACAGGVVSAHLVNNDFERAREAAIWYRELFGEDFYLEIQNHSIPVDGPVLEGMPLLSKELGIPLIATNDCHYIRKEHATAHNALLHIRDASKTGVAVNIEEELRYGTDNFYFKSADEMVELFREYPEAIERSIEVVEKCSLEIPQELHMPEFPIPTSAKADNLDDYLRELTWAGLEKRYDTLDNQIKERAEFELDVITRIGYASYFLIVQDFIRAARDLGVRVGPGRGSAAGSIVAYSLRITDIDPLKYNLLFERFLNPDRVSMPDIDVDFADDKREEVIEYVKQKYGQDAVSQIITFSTLSSRAVLKDVGRVLGIPHTTINNITKHIQVKFGRVQKLKDALENPELRWVKESADTTIEKLIEYSLVLEGFSRAASTHAAGVVIAPGPLEDYIPLYKTPTTGLASQYTMKYLEDAGLLKMDFLGLRTLSIIEDTLELIRGRHGIDIDIDAVPIDDTATYKMISKGLTTAVFQFESPPMQKYLKQLKPERLDDLIAMNALYRPGPMENIPDFIERRHGRKEIEYLHEKLEPILGTTYGICVYQEQIMQIAQQLGSFTIAQADTLRRAMGKKQIQYMEEMKGDYFEGCSTQGIDKKTASEIWDMMVKFADYGFNKCHSAPYAYIAYQTAYLKARYPAEFLAANMTHEANDQSKVVKLIDECSSFNVKVLSPEINQSTVNFSVDKEGQIIFGMAAIKNVGHSTVQAILDERQKGGPFVSIFDFTKRMAGNSLMNKRLLEHLVLAGAFDSIHPNRHQCFEAIDSAIGYGGAWAEQKASGMDSLFALEGAVGEEAMIPEPTLPDVNEWNRLEKLKREKKILDFYVSGHPLEDYALEAESFAEIKFGELPEELDTTRPSRVCGVVSYVRTKLDRRENQFAIVGIEDFTGKAECIFWSDSWLRNASMVTEGAMVFVTGRPEIEGADMLRIVCDDVIPMSEALQKYTKGIAVNVVLDNIGREAAEQTVQLVKRFEGDVQCIFRAYDNQGTLVGRWTARNATLSPSRELLRELYTIYGRQNVLIAG